MRSSLDIEERFNALYRTHRAAVLRYASRRSDPDTARDVVTETFLVAWRRHSAIPDDPDQVEPWLYGVARRVLANAERSARRTQRLTVRLRQVSRDHEMPDPAIVVTERELLAQALRRLPPRDQEALRLVGWEELDLAGAALAMGCSQGAMAARLYRARQKLKVALSASSPASSEVTIRPISRQESP